MSDQNPADLSQDKEGPSSEASEKLKSRVIVAYEQALRNGLTPCGAFAIMLDWVAEETSRIRVD